MVLEIVKSVYDAISLSCNNVVFKKVNSGYIILLSAVKKNITHDVYHVWVFYYTAAQRSITGQRLIVSIIFCNYIAVKGVADDRLWSGFRGAIERRCVDRVSSRPVSDDALHGGDGWKPTQSPVTGLQ